MRPPILLTVFLPTVLGSSVKKPTKTPLGKAANCTVTEYEDISSAVKSCMDILLSNISVPASNSIDLQKLQAGATVTFDGTTASLPVHQCIWVGPLTLPKTFGITPSDKFTAIVISGTNTTITGTPGHTIDGNGQAYWDGQGSNGGSPKPDHFIDVKKTTNARITNLNIKNWPTHCFDMTDNQGLTVTGLNLDNSEGDAANSSGNSGVAANTDGFDISSSDNVVLDSIRVHNQDDCVAVTSGSNITIKNMYCYGGHGLSIGSIGGKSNNTVDGVIFQDSQIINSENGCRIKTNSGKTGTVNNVTYQNITVSGITTYGIDVQEDYLNGGPTGKPTNGVKISGVHFIDITGTATSGYNYYILCGQGSCTDITFEHVTITGGEKGATCNFPASGCPA